MEDVSNTILKVLVKHPEGLTINQVADELGIHRHTLTKYIYELSGAEKITIRKVGVAKLCYINGHASQKGHKKGQTDPVSIVLILLALSSVLGIYATSQTSVNILNPYSNPVLHGQWVVNFTTVGIGQLSIGGVNGTTFEGPDGRNDLRFIGLFCDGVAAKPSLIGDKVTFKSYSCSGQSSLRLMELTDGNHAIEIALGRSIGYAYNYADCTVVVDPMVACNKCDVSEMDYLAYSDSGAFVSDNVMTSGGNPVCSGTGNSQENYTYSLGYTFCPSEDAVRWTVVATSQGDTNENEINTSYSPTNTLIIDDFNNGANGWTTSALSGIDESNGTFTAYTGSTAPSMTLDVADFTATNYKYAIVKTKNINATSASFYLYWIGTNCESWSSSCGIVGIDPINTTSNSWHVYLFNLSSDADWTNTVTQIALYPYYGTAGVNFSIDYVILVNSTPTVLYTPDFDGDTNWCTCKMGSGYFNLGGEVGSTTCCGDDDGENKRTKVCDGQICSSSTGDDACCDDSTDCVASSTCYKDGTYLPSLQGAVCLNGTWTNSTPVSASPTIAYPNLTIATTFKRIGNATAQLNATDIEGASGISYAFGNITKPDASLGQDALFISSTSIANGSTLRYAGPSNALSAAYGFESANQSYAFDMTNFTNDGTYGGETFSNGSLSYYENIAYNFDTASQYYYIYEQSDYENQYNSPAANTTVFKQGTGAINVNKSQQYYTTSSVYGNNITATDMKYKYANLWVYVNNKTTLDKISGAYIYLFDTYRTSTWSVYQYFSKASSLKSGWNLLSFNASTATTGSGTPNLNNVGNFRFDIVTNQYGQMLNAGDVVIDDLFVTNATPTGPLWKYGESTCRFGNCLDFNGKEDYVNLSNSQALNVTGAGLTLEAWAYPDDNTAVGIIHKGAHYSLYVNGSGNLTYADSITWNYATIGGYGYVPASQWSHLAVTFDGAQIKFYIDGNNVGTVARAGSLTGNGSMPFIGCYSGNDGGSACTSSFFDGMIDNARIWNRSLSATEINQSRDSPYPPSRDGLVGWWTMDEGNGTTVYDTHWKVTGQYGAGASFDGTNDYIQVTDSAELRPSSAFTAMSWIKPSAETTMGNFRTVLSKELTGTNRNLWFGLWDNSNDAYCNDGRVALRFTVSGANKTACGTTDLGDTSAWHHVAATYNGSGIALYVDGSLQNSTVASGAVDTQSGQALFIGVENTTAKTGYFNGTMDDVRIYSRALTAEEINQSMNMTFSPSDVGQTPGTWTMYALVNDTAGKGMVTSSTFIVEDNIPLYRATMVNNSNTTVDYGATVNMTTETWDDIYTGYAWLETNESGAWANQTCGSSCYSSMMNQGPRTDWTQANFTWRNASVPAGTDIGWKIWFNDSYNQLNVTPSQILVVRDYNPPNYTGTAQNTSAPAILAGVNLSTNAYEEYNIRYAVLETNESGSWANKTVTVMGSKNKSAYFAWGNTSMYPGQTVKWRIWLNDSFNQYNVTPEMSFHLNLSELFNYITGDKVYSSAAIGDVDSDGYMDVVIGANDNKVYALNASNAESKWNYTVGNAIGSSPTLANVTGDSKLEVIVGSLDNKIYVLNGTDGTSISNYTTGDMVWSSPAIYDIDGDGTKEIIVGSADGKIYVFNVSTSGSDWTYDETADETSCSGTWSATYTCAKTYDSNWDTYGAYSGGIGYAYFNYTKPSGATSSSLWEVKDTVQRLNLTVLSNCWSQTKLQLQAQSSLLGGVWACYDGSTWQTLAEGGPNIYEEAMWWSIPSSSALTSKWNYTTGGIIWSSPLIADLDGDSSYDVLIASYDNKLYALNKSGASMWNFTAGDDIESTPAVVDFGDAYKQVVFGSYDDKIYSVWANNGSQAWSYTGTEWFIASPNYGDIDGDTNNEVVIGGDDGVIYAFNAGGSSLWNYTLPTGGRIESSPALADMNGDGIWDVVVGASDNYVYALKGTDGSLIWRYNVGGYVYSSPSMEDIMGYGRMDTIVGTLGNKVKGLDPAWDRFGGNAGRSRLLDDSAPDCMVRNATVAWANAGQNVSISLFWKDMYSNLGDAWFWENSTGNVTFNSTDLPGLQSWFNNSFTMPLVKKETVYYEANATDTSGNVHSIEGYVNVKECNSNADCPLYYECSSYLCVYVPPRYTGQPTPEVNQSSGKNETKPPIQTTKNDTIQVNVTNVTVSNTTANVSVVVNEIDTNTSWTPPQTEQEVSSSMAISLAAIAVALIAVYALSTRFVRVQKRTNSHKKSSLLPAFIAFAALAGVYAMVCQPQFSGPRTVATSDGISVPGEVWLGIPVAGVTGMASAEAVVESPVTTEINLKTWPYGSSVAEGWEMSPTDEGKSAIAHVKWKTDEGAGAGNIYIGYSYDGQRWIEKGPFNESVSEKDTLIELGRLGKGQLAKLQLRFRGEDMDRMLPAFAYVQFSLEFR